MFRSLGALSEDIVAKVAAERAQNTPSDDPPIALRQVFFDSTRKSSPARSVANGPEFDEVPP